MTADPPSRFRHWIECRDDPQLVKLVQAGHPSRRIAELMQMSPPTILQHMKRLGLKPQHHKRSGGPRAKIQAANEDDRFFPSRGPITPVMLNNAYGYAGRTFASEEEARAWAGKRRCWISRVMEGENGAQRCVAWLVTLA